DPELFLGMWCEKHRAVVAAIDLQPEGSGLRARLDERHHRAARIDRNANVDGPHAANAAGEAGARFDRDPIVRQVERDRLTLKGREPENTADRRRLPEQFQEIELHDLSIDPITADLEHHGSTAGGRHLPAGGPEP